MKRAVIVTVAAIASAIVLPSEPADAASVIQFGKIQYDAPGSDSSSNVNGEYVSIRNTSSRAVSLTKWTVRDAANHVYTFGTYSLPAGKTLVLRSGKGTNTTLVRYWGSGWHIWNNPGDKAYLRNGAGAQVDYCAWSSNGSGYTGC